MTVIGSPYTLTICDCCGHKFPHHYVGCSELLDRPILKGKDLLEDMERYGKRVSENSDTSREFLKRLGVIDEDGNRVDLIKD